MFGISSLGTNKDQLLHRIQSVWTIHKFTIYAMHQKDHLKSTGTKAAYEMMMKLNLRVSLLNFFYLLLTDKYYESLFSLRV